MISTSSNIMKPINARGPVVFQTGALVIVVIANAFVSPKPPTLVPPIFHTMVIIMTASGNSYAIIVAISLCAPTVT